MQTRNRHAAGVALLLAATAACSDAPSAPTDRPAPEASHEVSTAISRAVAVAFSTYFPGQQAVDLPAACPYSAPDGAFVCAPTTIGELTYAVSYRLFDADGRALAAAGDGVATLRAVIDRRGVRHATSGDLGLTTAVADHHEMVASGLRTGTLTLSGTVASHYEVSGSAGNAPRSVEDDVGTFTNVLFDDGAAWPRAGTITASGVTSVVTEGEASPTTLRTRSAIEFDGTSVVTITTSTDTFTLRCRFDLAGRVATTCS